jgi:hypothetical protein
MYIGYLHDRQELGFNCLKDIHTVKQLSNLKSTLAIPELRILKKGKQTLVLLFSKEALIAVLIFMKSTPDFDRSAFSSTEVYQCCLSKSDTSAVQESLKSPSPILDSILKLKGGYDEMTSEEQEKLINSLLAKIPEHSYQETSINKFFKKFLKFIDPVISDHKFWRILSESKKPIKSQLSGPSEVRSTDILVPSQNGPDKQAKTRSKGSSSFFAEALSIPNTRKLSPMHKRVQLNMSKKETNFSNKLESSGLSKNHEELPQNIQYIEIKTKLRRAQPLYSSEVLGNSYEYGGKQLERKAPRHLPDFGISIVGKSIEELAVEYKDLVETILSKQGLVVRKDGTLNKQEPTINMGDPETLGIVAFEKNPLYDKHRFISSYPVSQEAFDHFVETGEIGLSPEEKKTKIDAFQKKQAQAERERTTARSFYSSLPEDARIGNQQLREVEGIQERLKEDPNSPLTEKEKNLIQRAENYQRYKDQFYQNNPDIDRDEL